MTRRILLLSLSFLCTVFVLSAAADEVLTWQDCLKEAAKNHPDLISAEESVTQAQESKKIAASGLFPQVTASADLTVTEKAKSGSSKSSSAGVSASQLLFDAGKTVNQTKAAGANITAAEENFHYTSSLVRLRLRTAFIDLLRAQDLVGIADDIYKIRRQDLELISLRYKSGTEHKGALLTAQANLASAQFGINEAKRAVTVAADELIKELGRKDFAPLKVAGELKVTQDMTASPDWGKIADRHPSLLNTIAQKNAAAFDVNASRADFFPSVSLAGGSSKSGTNWPPGKNSSDVGVSVSLPIFEGGSRRAALEKARSVYRQLGADATSTREGIILSLQQAWNTLENSVENIDVQQKILEATQERAKIAEAQYAVGLISFDNWTIIEDDLVRQKTSLLDAQANALLAQAKWVAAKGETLEYEK